jgi:hypothetical protein
MFTPFANQNQFDPDAGAFINATGIGGIEAVAINNLVNQLKSAGLWSIMKAIYPMVGGSANTHKFNLINPQDTDAAFRLVFAGGWTHNSSGAKPDGASGTYADTFFIPSAQFGANDAHLSYYSFTNNTGSDDVEMGANDGAATTGESLLALRFSDNNQYVFMNQIGGSGGAPGTSAGYLIGTRSVSANTAGYRNGTSVIGVGGGATLTGRKIYLGAQNNGTTSYRNSSRGCAFASMGLGMDSAMAVNLTNIVNNFQRTLQRNVF